MRTNASESGAGGAFGHPGDRGRRPAAGPVAVAVGTALLLTGVAGCSVGPGAPDGWRYVRTGAVAVALPKTWRVTADDASGLRAELPGPHGGADAALAVVPAAPTTAAAAPPAPTRTRPRASPGAAAPAPGTTALATPRARADASRAAAASAARRPGGTAASRADALVPARPVPADARRQTLAIDGSPARVFSFARPAPDGRPAAHVEVRLHDPAGRAVTVRAWAVDGAAHDPALLQEIVNSIEFPGR